MASRVEIANGILEGITRTDHCAFLGIPYARPPVGALRFCPPQPAQSWSGVREAKHFGNSAMQGTPFVPGDESCGAQSEDCLYLNVFTKHTGPRKRPVLVWFHGGAYTVGSASLPLYDGGPLTVMGDVVVVTVNYRLGAFGFLFLGDAERRMDASANLGILDQIQALRWVRDNVSGFGGDPNNVTIFGESAGATSVCAILTAPSADGLYHRAIAQSSALRPRHFPHSLAEQTTNLLLKKLDLAPARIDQLRALPAEQIAQAQRAIEDEGLTWLAFFPVQHEDSLPEDALDALRNPERSLVPLIIGSTRDEWNLFDAVNVVRWNTPMSHGELVGIVERKLEVDSTQAEQLIDGYRRSRVDSTLPSNEHALLRAIQGDHRFGIPSLRFAEAYARRSGPVFTYRFNYASPALRGALGACHALDLPFVFGTHPLPSQERFAGKGPHVAALSALMMRSWLSLAQHGGPVSRSDWHVYDLTARTTMIFDVESKVVNDPLPLEREAWRGIWE